MKPDSREGQWLYLRRSMCCALLAVGLLAGCAQTAGMAQPERYDARGPLPVLAYYQMLGRLSASELAKERSMLANLPGSPNVQIRQAMVIGHPRGVQDTARAMAVLEAILKSADAQAVELQPVARLLMDHYAERLRLESQIERQGGQLKENQRKVQELQEKLDGLADIERTLRVPSRSGKGVKP